MNYSQDILDRYEKNIQSRLRKIKKSLNKEHKIIAPGIVQYDFNDFKDLYRNVHPFVEPLCLNEYIFRGHSHSRYELKPTVKRNCKEKDSFEKEFRLLTQFAEKLVRRNIPIPNGGQHFIRSCEFRNTFNEWLPLEVLDFVAYARHAGLQTRMLDWTYDFWTAVYFAASGIIDEVREKISFEKKINYYMDFDDHSGIIDEVRKNISLEKNSNYYMDFDDHMVIWLFNLSLWRELTDDKRPRHPYGLYKSNLHFITPDYHENANAYAQKGLLSYFTLRKDKINKESTVKVLEDWNSATEEEDDNLSLDEYIAKGYERFMECDEYDDCPPIPIMLKFTIPVREALDIVDSIICLGYTMSSIYPSAENCVKEIQYEYEDDYKILSDIFKNN